MKILVSACLLGINCRYNGARVADERVLALREKHELIPVCPEQLGGLATPREPSEILGDRVITKSGRDVTAEYELGSQQTLDIANMLGCQAAVFQERSPSCGCGIIYDGTFLGKRIAGNGITTRLLIKNGIMVLGQSGVDMLL